MEPNHASLDSNERIHTEIYHQFLGREVHYRVDEIEPGPSLAQEWHWHNADQFLVPLQGNFRLDLRGASDLATLELTPGKQYKVPALYEHRVLSNGGLLESFLLNGGRVDKSPNVAEEIWGELTSYD